MKKPTIQGAPTYTKFAPGILSSSISASEDMLYLSVASAYQQISPARGFYGYEKEERIALQPDLWYLNEQIKALNSRIDKLASAIESLTKIMNPPIQQFLIEEIEFDSAKKLVVDYLKEHKTVSLSELAETLKIDLLMLSDIVKELKEEGLIKERD